MPHAARVLQPRLLVKPGLQIGKQNPRGANTGIRLAPPPPHRSDVAMKRA